ncbi:MAG: hypothetical protein PHQ19_02305 [Candidatus Krumholzibacteria bacterium]|nr:hypothetical protein [Candidatus Krumholzibacteria bacterium]
MTGRKGDVLRWCPRVLGICVAVFIGLFALDSVGDGIVPFLIHLIPAFALLAVALVSYRWEWIGGIVFTGLGIVYAVGARRHLDWVLIISGPLILTGLLFFLSRRARRRTGASS